MCLCHQQLPSHSVAIGGFSVRSQASKSTYLVRNGS
ncbi:hypothetical protein CMEL01_10100 [Colletotrichum melonis]|uniref:Uncharacterized protein n=1 Tax=Colletotrichum melonis TaxID=1209925 RepID=A0AAI9TUE5_9PEZI|nr:hypothetical protein CMEL01_10100 [Colletotrichum melonis]